LPLLPSAPPRPAPGAGAARVRAAPRRAAGRPRSSDAGRCPLDGDPGRLLAPRGAARGHGDGGPVASRRRARRGLHAGQCLLRRRRGRAGAAPLLFGRALFSDRRGRATSRRQRSRARTSPGAECPRARARRAAGLGAATVDFETRAARGGRDAPSASPRLTPPIYQTARLLGALRPNTRAVFVESLSNPLLRMVDLETVAAPLAARGIDLIVDSSLASPAVMRPLEHGATIVMHSLTKFISGHGDVTGGIVLGSKATMDRVRAAMIRSGTNLGPFDAWLATRGARTLSVRVERQSANALAL